MRAHTPEEAAHAAGVLKQRKRSAVHSDEYKQGYYDGVNDLLERIRPTCGECGRPYDLDALGGS